MSRKKIVKRKRRTKKKSPKSSVPLPWDQPFLRDLHQSEKSPKSINEDDTKQLEIVDSLDSADSNPIEPEKTNESHSPIRKKTKMTQQDINRITLGMFKKLEMKMGEINRRISILEKSVDTNSDSFNELEQFEKNLIEDIEGRNDELLKKLKQEISEMNDNEKKLKKTDFLWYSMLVILVGVLVFFLVMFVSEPSSHKNV